LHKVACTAKPISIGLQPSGKSWRHQRPRSPANRPKKEAPVACTFEDRENARAGRLTPHIAPEMLAHIPPIQLSTSDIDPPAAIAPNRSGRCQYAFCSNNDHLFEPEEIDSLILAFENTLRVLGLTNREDPLTVAVAKLIIQLAKDDERDPGRLRDGVLEALGRAAPPASLP
jgi:hypothetical protein